MKSKDEILEHARSSGLLKGSVKYKELNYKSGETHTIVFKDHSRSPQTNIGSATVVMSQGNTMKLNGATAKQEKMLQLVQSFTMP